MLTQLTPPSTMEAHFTGPAEDVNAIPFHPASHDPFTP